MSWETVTCVGSTFFSCLKTSVVGVRCVLCWYIFMVGKMNSPEIDQGSMYIYNYIVYTLDPKTMKNEGFTPPKYGL